MNEQKTTEMTTKLVEALENCAFTTEPWTGKIPSGKHVRQGDVYLCNEPAAKKGKIIADGNDRTGEQMEKCQLAPGNTRGSRHVLAVSKGVKVYAPAATSPFIGVIIEVEDGATAEVSHPTHRQFNVQGPANLQVRFPRDLSDPHQMRRLAD